MEAGQLFVSIFLKGGQKAVNDLSDVRKSLSSVYDTSLETKAAIVGVLYGLEQLMSSSAKLGTSLSTFATTTGLSAQELQKWEYAGAGASVTVDEMTTSIKNAKDAITKMQMTGEGPPIFFWLMKSTKLDEKKIDDTFYLMRKLQEMASHVGKEINPAQFTQLARQMGIADNLTAAFIKQKFNAKAFAQAPQLSNEELANLTAADAAWMKLFYNMRVGMGKLVAQHGLPIMKDIEKLLPSVQNVLKAFSELVEKTHALSAIGLIFDGWAKIFDGIAIAAGAMNDALGNTAKTEAAKEKKDKEGMWYWFKENWHAAGVKIDDYVFDKVLGKNYSGAVRPRIQVSPSGGTIPQYSVNQNNYFQWDGGADPNVTIDATRKATQQAVKGFVDPHGARKKP